MHKAHISPSLFGPPSYAHSTTATKSDLFFTSGGVPLDATGKLVGDDDLQAQTEQVVHNLHIVLAENGYTFDNVIKTTVYVVAEREGSLAAVWQELIRLGLATDRTASTLLGVSQLGYPGQLVEIELVAALHT